MVSYDLEIDLFSQAKCMHNTVFRILKMFKLYTKLCFQDGRN
ncbi:hypothetical protein HMPREF9136_2626 [Prevotella dentalis DSM 3688]|uniref:Uncharacterized protein n=1 Tax=Prevotella dentalis (strain ATCC 49559 / DSM 3688 / JCM 13448 / NCTC 12043 / ES 2772) TaxID=908937 RepID=F9D6Z8_PREDD|nr:hypothetical protein HMPREF9136_2626 [Prevotella dentalis DSM 3688]